MLKYIIGAALLIFSCCSVSEASGDSVDVITYEQLVVQLAEVPTSSQVYEAMSNLDDSGLMTRYPQGFFSGAVPRLWIEFSIATADLVESRKQFTAIALSETEILSFQTLEAVFLKEQQDSPTAMSVLESTFHDVPKDHWAYDALQHLANEGILEGYPDDFFDGERMLTRYEFAQALARMLDTMGPAALPDWSDMIVVEALRYEFSVELNELSRDMDELCVLYGE